MVHIQNYGNDFKKQKVTDIYHLKVDLLQYSPITECYVAIKKKK